MKKQVGLQLDVELLARVDAARGPGVSRTQWLVEAAELKLGGGGVVRAVGVPVAAVVSGAVRRVPVAEETPLPVIAPRRPVESRAVSSSVREKPVRLEVARRVKSAAEAKAGLLPVGWKDGA